MPPRGVKSPKRKRQYEKIKTSARRRGTGERRAKEIAARTVNKQRSKAGQTKGAKSRKASSARTSAKSSRKPATRKSTRSRSSTSKRTTGRKKK